MKVADIMQKSVIKVNFDDPLKDVARIIFSLGISAVLVVDKKRLAGIVTEEDILSNLDSDIAGALKKKEDTNQELDKRIKAFLEDPINKVMNSKPFTISSSSPIEDAQNLMLKNKFSKLPVLSEKKELVGIITLEDIFKYIFENEVTGTEKEKYAEYVARSYDYMVDWGKRFAYELPALFNVFRKNKIQKIIDLGVWTGEYTIKLASEGVGQILGLDHNPSMIEISKEKLKRSPSLSKNVRFALSNFDDFNKTIKGTFDAAICLGNSLPYLPVSASTLFANLSTRLSSKGTVILQVLNTNKVIKKHGMLLSFVIQPSDLPYIKEHLLLEFLEKTDSRDKLIHHVVIFDNDGKNWIFNGVTSVEIFNYSKDDLEKALKDAGFTQISSSGNNGEYQGDYGQLNFQEKFDPENSDWLNIIAVKK